LILTLTLNPAIDRNVTADRLVFEDRAYILSTSESAGGRGINASLVIHSFGGETLAIAICGGKSGKRMEEYLGAMQFPSELVRVKNEIRTNLNIADRQGLAIKLNELGPAVSALELGRVEKAVRAQLGKAKWLMLCGSLPPGVKSDCYARLIAAARKEGVKTLLDTDGDALLAGLAAKPTVVTPNQQEAERLLNRALITRAQFLEAAQQVRSMGAENVILSLGARGAIGALADGSLVEVIPPRVDALCPIGSGDAMAAAFTWSMSRGREFADALRWGVAAGTASATLPGISFASLEQTERLYRQVEIRTES
jgi:1-phosphofructokinase family hexose kinase